MYHEGMRDVQYWNIVNICINRVNKMINCGGSFMFNYEGGDGVTGPGTARPFVID